MKRVVWLIACAGLLPACPPPLPSLSQALGPCGNAYLPLQAGNRWVYDLRQAGSSELGSALVEVVSADPAAGTAVVRSAVLHGDEGEHVQSAVYQCTGGAITLKEGSGVLPLDRIPPAAQLEQGGAQWTASTPAPRESGSRGAMAVMRQTGYTAKPPAALSTPAGSFRALAIDTTGDASGRVWLVANVGIVGVDAGSYIMRLRSAAAGQKSLLSDQAITARKPAAMVSLPQAGEIGSWCQCQCDADSSCLRCPAGYPPCRPPPAPPPVCPQPGTPGVTRLCDGDCGGDGCKKTTHWQLVTGHETAEFVGQVSGGGCDASTRSCLGGHCENPHIADGDYCQHHDDRDFNIDIVFPNQDGMQYLAVPNMTGGGENAGADIAVEWEWMYAFPGFRSDTWLAKQQASRGTQTLAPRIRDTVSLYGQSTPLELGVPWPGDPIAVHGFLVSDCGHPNAQNQARTEIHPPVVMAWVHRNSPAGDPNPTFTLWIRAATHPSYPRSGDGESWMKSVLHQTLPLPGDNVKGKAVVLGKLQYDYILKGYDNKNWCPGSFFGYGDQPYAYIRNNQFPLSQLNAINADPAPVPRNPYFYFGFNPYDSNVGVNVDVIRDEEGYPPLVGAHVEISLCDRVAQCAGKKCTDRVCGGALACGCGGTGLMCRTDGTCCNASCDAVACGQRNACGDVCYDGACPAGQICAEGGTCETPPTCPPPKILCNCDEANACMTAANCRILCRGDWCVRHPNKCPDGPPVERDLRQPR